MTWILAIISLAGNVLNSNKIVYGFHVWIICNVGWLIYDISNSIYARACLDLIQTALCLYGIRTWTKKDGRGRYEHDDRRAQSRTSSGKKC